MSHNSVGELRARGRDLLSRSTFDVPSREAGLILGRVLGWSEAQLLARLDHSVDGPVAGTYRTLIERRLRGEPFAYLFGAREFFGREFLVDRRVLIPRPETEHVVEAVLELDSAQGSRMLDVGTGSGCIALTLALERPDLCIVASDISIEALSVARSNRRRYGLDNRVSLVAGDLLSSVAAARFDVIVSNPPYIDPNHASQLSPEIRNFEPEKALFADRGLGCYERLFAQSLAFVRPGTRLILEIGDDQLDSVRRLAKGHTLEKVRHDYAGRARVVELVRNPLASLGTS